MYPWFQGWVEEFYPLLSYMEYKRIAQKQMLQAETGSHTTEIKQVPVKIQMDVNIE